MAELYPSTLGTPLVLLCSYLSVIIVTLKYLYKCYKMAQKKRMILFWAVLFLTPVILYLTPQIFELLKDGKPVTYPEQMVTCHVWHFMILAGAWKHTKAKQKMS